MKNLSLLVLFSSLICLIGCSNSDTADSETPPDPPTATEEDLGEATGSPEDMFLTDPDDDTEPETGSTTE